MSLQNHRLELRVLHSEWSNGLFFLAYHLNSAFLNKKPAFRRSKYAET